MLTTLAGRDAARRARSSAINPLRERGLVRFAHPQEPLGLLGARHARSPIASCRCASAATSRCSRASMKELLELEAERGPGACSTGRSSPSTRRASRRFAQALDARARATTLEAESGHRARRDARGCAELYAARRAHDRLLGDGPHAAPPRRRATCRRSMNLLLLRGNIGGRARARARCAATATCRATARWASGAAARRVPRRARARVRLRAAARATASTTVEAIRAMRDGARARRSSRWAATSRSRRPTPR